MLVEPWVSWTCKLPLLFLLMAIWRNKPKIRRSDVSMIKRLDQLMARRSYQLLLQKIDPLMDYHATR